MQQATHHHHHRIHFHEGANMNKTPRMSVNRQEYLDIEEIDAYDNDGHELGLGDWRDCESGQLSRYGSFGTDSLY
jgi:hypothetical protein